jgi:hypothetical protein
MILSFLAIISLFSGNLLAQEKIISAYGQKLIHLTSPAPDLPSIDLQLNSTELKNSEKQKHNQEKRELMNVAKGVDLIFSTKAYEKGLNPMNHCKPPAHYLQHTTYLGNESVNPFIIYQVQIPINTLIKPSQSFSFKMNSGNTLIHDSILTDQNNGTRRINFDAVIEKNTLLYTQPIGDQTEAFIVLSFYSASERGLINPLNWVVSDVFIEEYHETILGRTDIYGRKKLGYDHYAYQATDEDGNTFSLNKGKVYAFPLQLGTTHYQILQKNEKSLLSVNGTAAINVPVSKVGPQQLEAAVGGTFSATRKVSDNNSITGALHGSAQFHDLGNITKRNDVYDVGSTDTTYQVQALMGFNHLGKKGRENSFYITYNRSTLPLKDSKLSTTGGKLNQQAFHAATSGSEYLEVGASKTFNLENSGRLQVELAIREDLFSKFNDIKTVGGHSLFVGRNAEDFGVFLGVRYEIKNKKPKR